MFLKWRNFTQLFSVFPALLARQLEMTGNNETEMSTQLTGSGQKSSQQHTEGHRWGLTFCRMAASKQNGGSAAKPTRKQHRVRRDENGGQERSADQMEWKLHLCRGPWKMMSCADKRRFEFKTERKSFQWTTSTNIAPLHCRKRIIGNVLLVTELLANCQDGPKDCNYTCTETTACTYICTACSCWGFELSVQLSLKLNEK